MKPADRADLFAEGHEPPDCPRYDRCSAPLCPLDPGWHKRAVLPNEEFCPYLRELAKPNVLARYVDRYDLFVIEAAGRLREAIRHERHPRYAFIEPRILSEADNPSQIDITAARSERMRSLHAAKKGAPVDETIGESTRDGVADLFPPVGGDDATS